MEYFVVIGAKFDPLVIDSFYCRRSARKATRKMRAWLAMQGYQDKVHIIREYPHLAQATFNM